MRKAACRVVFRDRHDDGRASQCFCQDAGSGGTQCSIFSVAQDELCSRLSPGGDPQDHDSGLLQGGDSERGTVNVSKWYDFPTRSEFRRVKVHGRLRPAPIANERHQGEDHHEN